MDWCHTKEAIVRQFSLVHDSRLNGALRPNSLFSNMLLPLLHCGCLKSSILQRVRVR